MPITLAQVAANPGRYTKTWLLRSGEQAVLRPLETGDVEKLADFLVNLSLETRRLSTFEGYDAATAIGLCAAINRYDKLRFVVETRGEIIGLMEFSMDIPAADQERFRRYGLELSMRDCRFGPTLADTHQNQGIGSTIFSDMVAVARQFGKERIILWGGVLADNVRAIRYYEKNGFICVGEFDSSDNILCVDMMLDL